MNKRAAKCEYKEAKFPAGVYRVHNVAEDRSLVGASVNLPAILNRHRSGLRMGGHENKDLQRDWNRLGEAGSEQYPDFAGHCRSTHTPLYS